MYTNWVSETTIRCWFRMVLSDSTKFRLVKKTRQNQPTVGPHVFSTSLKVGGVHLGSHQLTSEDDEGLYNSQKVIQDPEAFLCVHHLVQKGTRITCDLSSFHEKIQFQEIEASNTSHPEGSHL